jgi:hypothetical protein
MATTFVDYEGVVCADWLNQVSRTVEDALGSANTPAQARTALGVIGEAPLDNAIYGRQNGSWVVVSVGGSPATDYIVKTPTAQENIINPGGTGSAYPLIINAHADQSASVPLLLVRDSSEDPTLEVFETGVVVTEKSGQANDENLFAVLKADDTPVLRVTTGDATDDNIVWIGNNPQVDGAIKLVGTGFVRAGITRYSDAFSPLLRLESDVEGSTNQTYANRAILFHGHKSDLIPDPAKSSVIEVVMDESRIPTGTQKVIAQLRGNEGDYSMYGELVLGSAIRSNGDGITAQNQTWQMVCAGVISGTAGKLGWYYGANVPDGDRETEVLHLRSTGQLVASGWSISSTGTLTPTSDASLKENITDAGSKLAGIRALKVREFDFKADQRHETGFVAQEVAEVFPELVEEREDGLLSYQESLLNRYLIKAVQELAAQVEELRHAA